MKIRKTPDVVEVDASVVEEAVRQAVKAITGRDMDTITWVNIRDGARDRKDIYLNATLKPESE